MKTKRHAQSESQRAANRKIERSMDNMIFALAKNRVERFPAQYAGKDGEINAIAFCRNFYHNKHEAMVACFNFGV